MRPDKLTAERLRYLVHYNQDTGIFTNKAPRKKIRVGEIAGTLDKSTGYIVLRIDRRNYYAHRLAFLYMTGNWPTHVTDHIDGVRNNNAFANLRDVPRVVNQQNMRSPMPINSTGLIGACRKRKRWSAQIKVHGNLIRLGIFDTAEEAHVAYVKAKRELHIGCTI